MVEATKAPLIQSKLPNCLRPYAFKHAYYVRNLVPHSAISVSSYAKLMNQILDLGDSRVFGYTAYVLRLPGTSKFESRVHKAIYSETVEHGVFCMLVRINNIYKLVESRHVTFDENCFPGAPHLSLMMKAEIPRDESEQEYQSNHITCAHESEEVSIDDISEEEKEENQFTDTVTTDVDGEHDDCDSPTRHIEYGDHGTTDAEVAEPSNEARQHDKNASRYPRRDRRPPPKRYIASSAVYSSKQIKTTTNDEPTLGENMSTTLKEIAERLVAKDEAFESLETNLPWDLDSASESSSILHMHIVLKFRQGADGTDERFKARVVASGNFQAYEQSYLEIYIPVVSFDWLCIFLYVALLKMVAIQIDMRTALFHGELEENT